jgi:hypothetical protein
VAAIDGIAVVASVRAQQGRSRESIDTTHKRGSISNNRRAKL